MTNNARQKIWGRSERRALILGLVVGIPVSVVFMGLALRDVSPDAVRAAFRAADIGLVLLGVAAISCLYPLQAARWRTIARTSRPGLSAFVEWVVAAVACNNVIPGRLGELFRARWLAVAAPMPTGRALGTVGIDRACDVLTLFTLLVVSLPFVTSAAWVGRMVVAVAIVLLATLGGLVAARVYTRRRPRERHGRGRLRGAARDVLDSLAEPLGRRRAAKALALSMLAWSAFGVTVWLVARSVGVELTVSECAFVTGSVNLGVAIPSSPGFVGTYQWLAVASLGVFGVPASQALAFSILLHASWYFPTTVVGGALLLFRVEWRRPPATHGTTPDAKATSGSPLG